MRRVAVVTLLIGLTMVSIGLARAVSEPALPNNGVVPPIAGSSAGSAGPLNVGRSELSEAAAPVRLAVPSLAVDAAVVPVGIQPGGELAVPDDPSLVGWWQGGARPGAALGTTVLDGHVDSYLTGSGALFHVADLRPGATVSLGTSAGSLTYVVQAVRSYPKQALPADVFDTTGQPRLVIITCGGEFDQLTRQYSHNIVAYGVPQ
jgi:hypothetical protein